MAEAQEKRVDETNSESVAEQNKFQNDTKNQNTSSSGDIANKVENALGVEAGTTKDIYKQAKETAGQAFGKVSEKAATQIGEQKDTLARGLSGVADNIRQMGENLRGAEEKTPVADIAAKYGDSLAKQVEQVSTYLEQKDLRAVLRDVEGFARRNPAVFIGGAFALGLLAARFLKSGGNSGGLSAKNLKENSQFKSDGLHLPKDLDKQFESSTEGEPFRFGDSNAGNTTSTSGGPASGNF